MDLLFPPLCLGCGSHWPNFETNALCSQCFEKIIVNSGFFCPICHRRLPDLENRCHKNSLFWLGAATNYENKSVRAIIQAFKYQQIFSAGAALEEVMRNYCVKIRPTIESFSEKPTIIMPLPLYPKKEKQRGFNQALILAQAIFEQFKKDGIAKRISLEKNLLIKIKNSPSQTKCRDYAARAINIKDCFQLTDPAAIKNKNVILVDDVFTSGATASEAVRVLKKAGAKKTIVLVAAKA